MISERQDIDYIDEINSIITEIRKKLDSRDYGVHELSWFVKPIKYVHTMVGELNVYLTPIKTNIDGYFHYKDHMDFKAPFILLHNTKFKRNQIVFDEDTMSHELQHYIDWKRGNKFSKTTNILNPEGGINPEYYNQPTELNAYIIQILRQYIQAIKLKNLSEDFQRFYKDFWKKTEIKDFWKHLTDENKKKFGNRIYLFHQKLIERKQSLGIRE